MLTDFWPVRVMCRCAICVGMDEKGRQERVGWIKTRKRIKRQDGKQAEQTETEKHIERQSRQLAYRAETGKRVRRLSKGQAGQTVKRK